MSRAAPSCSVVIRAFNEERHIGRLLTGIGRQSVGHVEVIVVDSGSTDATVSVASRLGARVVSIEPHEFSFGRSLNRGIQAARGELIVIASAHVYPVYEDWLERLLAPFAEPAVVLTYGRQRGDESSAYSERRILAAWFPATSRCRQAHPFCNNANAAIRRATWNELRFDESLTGLEDVEWASRALARGHRIDYVAEAEVVHVHDETPRQVFNRYRREAIALRRIDPGRRFGLGGFLRFFVSNAISDCYHALREGCLRRHVHAILLFRLMQFWGTYRGFALHGPVTDALWRTFYYPAVGEERQRRRAASRVDYSDIGEGGGE